MKILSSQRRRLRALWAGWQPLVPLVVTAGLLLLAVGLFYVWWIPRIPTAAMLRCDYGYRRARTAHDTAAVDAWEVGAPEKARRVNCGTLRATDSLRQAQRTAPGG